MNILAIGAHFDDVELGCAGTLARHIAEGDNVYIYVVTLSGYSNQNKKIVRSNQVAKKEGLKAMKILGVKQLICGNFKTLNVEFDERLNKEIIKIVNSKKIDCIYTHWHGDIHHDHQSVSKATMHSARHVKKILMYRSNWYESPYQFKGNYYVDITKTWNLKKKAILCHKSELNRVGLKWLDFFYNEAKNAGQKMNVDLAEVFELVKYLK